VSSPSEPYDIVVVGGGPVGLHAALKGAILNHRVLVVDKGSQFSRVSQAPAIANIPGHPGISGLDLLRLHRESLDGFRDIAGKNLVTVLDGTEAFDVARDEEGFHLKVRAVGDGTNPSTVSGKVLILATGTVDRKPGIGSFGWRGHETMAPYIRGTEVGYCLLCEGWHLDGKRVAVLGNRHDSVSIAKDVLGHFGGEVALITGGEPLEEVEDAQELEKAGIPLVDRPLKALREREGQLAVLFDDGTEERFDKGIMSLGMYKVNNELACLLGAKVTAEGYVVTDANCEALDQEGHRIKGLFAVGDLRAGSWKQIVVGWGDAETAVITAYAKRLD